MPILSLCTGVGMFDVAVEHITGDKTAYVAEMNPAASRVLAVRFPHAPNLGDITEVDWAAFAAEHSEINVIAAGFPCQDISNAGKRVGIGGSRSGVWKNVAQAIGHIRPRVAYLENVGALLTRGLNVVAEDLAEVGYDLTWTTLRASEVDLAHHRARWFGIASPADAGGPGLEVRGLEPARQEQPTSERGRPGAEDADGEPGPERLLAASRQASRGGHGPTLDDEVSHLLPDPDHIGRDGRSGDEPEPQGRNEPADRRHSPAEWWGDYLPAIRRQESVTGVPAPTPTEIGPRGGRRLAAPFAEWLMGWPAGWVTAVDGLTRAEQLQCIGNGVVPLQAIEALRRIEEIRCLPKFC